MQPQQPQMPKHLQDKGLPPETINKAVQNAAKVIAAAKQMRLNEMQNEPSDLPTAKPTIKMNTKQKGPLIILTAVTTLLILTNPSYEAFKQFTPDTGLKELGQKAVWRRTANFGVFSVYEKDMYQAGENEMQLVGVQRYCGFLLNFVSIK